MNFIKTDIYPILEVFKRFSNQFYVAVFLIFVVSFFEIFSLFPLVLLIKYGASSELSALENLIISSKIIDGDIYRLGYISLFALIVSGLSTLLAHLIYARLVWNTNLLLSYEVYKYNLTHSDFLSRSFSAGKSKKDISTETQQFSVYIVGAMANLFGRGLFIIIMIIAAAYFGYGEFVLILILYLFFMVLIIKMISNVTETVGKKREQFASEIFKSLDEGINNIASLRSLKRESFILDRFKEKSQGFKRAATKFSFLPSVPKAIIEISVYFAVIFIVLFSYSGFIKSTESLILPALFLIRLLPILVLISRNMTEITYAIPSAKALIDYFSLKNNKSLSEIDEINVKKIILENLVFDRKSLGRKDILVSQLEINAGEILVFWGESGSGKSTLAANISGLSNRNEINYDLYVNDKKYNSLIECLSFGFVSQSNSLFVGSLMDNISLGNNLDKKEILEFMTLLNLDHLKESLNLDIENLSTHFSGGEIQRISLLRAIINSKDLIVIDEPTSALDELSENSVYNVLQNLKKKNITIFLITHSKRIKDLADHIIEF